MNKAQASKNGAVRSRAGLMKNLKAGLSSNMQMSMASSNQNQTSSQFSKNTNPKLNIINKSKGLPMTKKQKEAQEAQKKKAEEFRKKQKKMKELKEECEEMIKMINETVKDPTVKRRNSIQAYCDLQNRALQQEEENEDLPLPSMFGDEVDFYEYRTKKKEDMYSKLEWRSQFKPIEEIVQKQREARIKEKSQRRDKSSDHHFVNEDLIRTIHDRATDEELTVLTKLTFLEKYIGVTNNEKRRMMLQKGKQKIDESYVWIRNTMVQSFQLNKLLEEKKAKIISQKEHEKNLKERIQIAQQELIRQDGLVEEARSELKQTESRKNQDIEDKDNEISEASIKLQLQQNEMKRLHEIAQLSYEDERSHCLKLCQKMDHEVAKSKTDMQSRNQSQELTDQEQNIDGQLSMSKPLVTEIMEFFSNKERESNNEQSLEELVGELQHALEVSIDAEERFRKAAHYDPSDNLNLQRQQRNSYAERTRFGN